MYRVTYSKLLEILEKGGYQYAIAELRERNITQKAVQTIEIDFTVENPNTPDQIIVVNEFNIFLENNIVLFGNLTKHGSDFTIQWASTKPKDSYKVLRDFDTSHIDEKTRENLEFLQTRALDACEYTNTRKEQLQQYNEIDEAYTIILEYIKVKLETIATARNRLGDLSRIVEKMGDGEDLEVITKRIDEIYDILKRSNLC